MPIQGDPITLTLYKVGEKEQKTFSRLFIPWQFLKAALAVTENINFDKPEDSDLDKMAGLVTEAFGNEFTIADINERADMGEVMLVINTIISRATNSLPKKQSTPES